jgi:hypothetical protein
MPRQLDDRIYMEERIFDFVERSLWKWAKCVV